MPVTDSICFVKTYLAMFCPHWGHLLPWTKQIPTIKINSLRCQNVRAKESGSCSSSHFLFSLQGSWLQVVDLLFQA